MITETNAVIGPYNIKKIQKIRRGELLIYMGNDDQIWQHIDYNIDSVCFAMDDESKNGLLNNIVV